MAIRQLILGGARSGKSKLAETRAGDRAQPVIYVATAEIRDAEMDERIQLHRQQRPEDWSLIEEPIALAEVIQRYSGQQKTVLVDCLTLWVTNYLLADASALPEKIAELVAAVEQFDGNLLLVSNEVGWGIVPMGELSRQFQDHTGRLHQALAAVVEKVTLTVAGLPVEVKGAEL